MRLTRSEAMRLRHSVARVDGWLSAATAKDLAAGLEWYSRARGIVADLSAESGLPVEHCAGVLAALSPRAQWATNVKSARAVVLAAAAGGPMPAGPNTTANRVKAWRIACGESPGTVLSGPKVRAFYAAVMGDGDAVTVDVWTARAAEGRRSKHAPVRRRYELCAEAFRRVARERSMTPRDVQATVWTTYRRVNARAIYDPAY